MSGGTEQPRDSRSMVSPRRDGRTVTGSAVRIPAARDPGAPPPLSVPRRLGVLVVVGTLLMAILLAWGGAGSRPTADPTPTASPEPTGSPVAGSVSPGADGPPPTVVPAIIAPEELLLRQRRITLTVTIPESAGPVRGLELRVYRNDEPAMDPVRVRGLTVNVRNVPLRRNENRITVALANSSGEGPRSEPLVLTVDDRAPRIDIQEPQDGSVINGTTATVRGITEAGLSVRVRNPTSGAVADVVSDDSGVFITEIPLDRGTNRIEVSTEDAAGNPARKATDVVRGDDAPTAKLTLSRQRIKLGDLPASLNIQLELTDSDGNLVDGAPVTFTIQPPGFLKTEIYTTVTEDGIARWDDVALARGGAAKGHGRVSARAELGDGLDPAIATKPFTIE